MKTALLRRFPVFLCIGVSAILPPACPLFGQSVKASASNYDWPQFGFDETHSGNDVSEKTITSLNVRYLHLIYRTQLPAVADGAPVYLSSVRLAGGTKNMVFLTTKEGHILAIDAATGNEIWRHQYPSGSYRINNGNQPTYTTSSPVIDPDKRWVYSYGLDGCVHKYSVPDGSEAEGNGWPERATLKPFDEKGSSALAIATNRSGVSYLYVANGGYLGDRGDYQGHLTTINLRDGSQDIFNTVCSNVDVHFAEKPGVPDCTEVQSAVWARAGVVYVAAIDRVFAVTGNGTFDPSRHHWGDSVIALHSDGTGEKGGPLDSYTPDNFDELQRYDLDLGSTAPAFIPAPKGCKVRMLGLQGGKDRKLRLLNLENLGGGGSGLTGGEIGEPLSIPQGGMMFTAPAVWTDRSDGSVWIFVATFNGVAGLKLLVNHTGVPSLHVEWTDRSPSSSPIIANGVLYCAGGRTIRGYDPRTGKILWQDDGLRFIHWESPIVDNGMLYITDESGALAAYGL